MSLQTSGASGASLRTFCRKTDVAAGQRDYTPFLAGWEIKRSHRLGQKMEKNCSQNGSTWLRNEKEMLTGESQLNGDILLMSRR